MGTSRACCCKPATSPNRLEPTAARSATARSEGRTTRTLAGARSSSRTGPPRRTRRPARRPGKPARASARASNAALASRRRRWIPTAHLPPVSDGPPHASSACFQRREARARMSTGRGPQSSLAVGSPNRHQNRQHAIPTKGQFPLLNPAVTADAHPCRYPPAETHAPQLARTPNSRFLRHGCQHPR